MWQDDNEKYEKTEEAFDQYSSMPGGIIGDFDGIPEGQILTEEEFKKLNLDPSQYKMIRFVSQMYS